MTKKQRSEAARKANATRKARKEFRETYPYTAETAELLLKGKSTREVADEVWSTTESVAAVLANLNRYGTFSLMALKCNF